MFFWGLLIKKIFRIINSVFSNVMDRHILTSTRATQNSAKYAAAVFAKGLDRTIFKHKNSNSMMPKYLIWINPIFQRLKRN